MNSHTYHVISGLPPDLAHDLFEGFAVDIVSSVVIRCIKSGYSYLTLESFNDIIHTFSSTDADKSNKLQPVKTIKPIQGKTDCMYVKCGIY